MAILSVVFFLILPIVSSILLFFGALFDRKHAKLYGVLLAIILAILAYHYTPGIAEDLSEHHADIIKMSQGFDSFFASSVELFQIFVKRLVVFFGDKNLLQAIITFLSYSIILFIVADICKDEKRIYRRALIYLFTLSSFYFLTIISNLFSCLAVLLFILGIYREYFQDNKTPLNWLYYIGSILIHDSMILPVVFLMIFKLFRNKMSTKALIAICVLVAVIPTIVSFLQNFTQVVFFQQIGSMYESYFLNQDQYSGIHPVTTIIFYLSKMTPFVLSWVILKCQKSDRPQDSIVLYFCIMICVLSITTTFSIRFVPIVSLLGASTMLRAFDMAKSKIIVFILVLVSSILIIAMTQYQVRRINASQFSADGMLFQSIFTIWSRDDG